MLRTEPTQIGPYKLLEPLGQGGMAIVYRAEREGEHGFRKLVALKRMLPHLRDEPKLDARFATEARTSARLSHPNIVQVIDYGTEPERFLVMEWVDGVSLAVLLGRLAQDIVRLPIAASLFIVAQAAAGLEHAHKKKAEDGTPLEIVHRDVSPQNILLSGQGEVKVSDFGLAKVADSSIMTTLGTRLGKIGYMAPEQIDGIWTDARTDVYALGVVLWECLTQQRLIPPDNIVRSTIRVKSGDFPAPSSINTDVLPELDDVVRRTLRTNADERTASAAQLSRECRTLMARYQPGFGAEDLAELLRERFPERGWD